MAPHGGSGGPAAGGRCEAARLSPPPAVGALLSLPARRRRGRAWSWRESIKSRRETRPPSCQSRRERPGRGGGARQPAPWPTPTRGATTATTVSGGAGPRPGPAPLRPPALRAAGLGAKPGQNGRPRFQSGPEEGVGGRQAGLGPCSGRAAGWPSLAGVEEAKLVEGEAVADVS